VWATENKHETARSGPAVSVRLLVEWALLRCRDYNRRGAAATEAAALEAAALEVGAAAAEPPPKPKRARVAASAEGGEAATAPLAAAAQPAQTTQTAPPAQPENPLARQWPAAAQARALDVLAVAVPLAEAFNALLVPRAGSSSAPAVDAGAADAAEAPSGERTPGGRLSSAVGAALSSWEPTALPPCPSPAANLWALEAPRSALAESTAHARGSSLLKGQHSQQQQEQQEQQEQRQQQQQQQQEQQAQQEQQQQQQRRAAAAAAMARHCGTLVHATGGFMGLVTNDPILSALAWPRVRARLRLPCLNHRVSKFGAKMFL